MSTLYPSFYPLGEPDLTLVSEYEVPTSTIMAYSRGNPYEDSFFIPTRFIPTVTDGHTMEFTAPHEGLTGLFPAFKVCSYIHVTEYTGHTFNNVTKDIVSIIVTSTTATVGYRDQITGNLIILGPLTLVDRPLITEEFIAPTPNVAICRTVKRRYTLAPNNLPHSITSNSAALEAGESVQVYFPPKDTVYSYVNISINNPYSETIMIAVSYIGPTATAGLIYEVAPETTFRLNNKIVIQGEEISIVNLSPLSLSVYTGMMHMRNI